MKITILLALIAVSQLTAWSGLPSIVPGMHMIAFSYESSLEIPVTEEQRNHFEKIKY